MRRIFNTLEETTPKPCSTETANFKATKKAWDDALAYSLLMDILNETKKSELEQFQRWVKDMETVNVNIEKMVKEAFLTIAGYRKSIPTANKYLKYYLEKGIKDLQEKIIRDNKLRNCYGRQIRLLNESIPDCKAEIAQNEINIKAQTRVVSKAATAMNADYLALSECQNSPLHIRLNLNPPCKELKQNIKIVNQKSISLNNKLINLNSGVSSLEILNINKDFFDKNIKNTKEFIILLDKLNPNPSDSSFLDVYKKAQDDLAFYQEKRKISRVKIKTSEEKIKTIPDKQNNLEDKTSNKIQKFVNCKTPTVI